MDPKEGLWRSVEHPWEEWGWPLLLMLNQANEASRMQQGMMLLY